MCNLANFLWFHVQSRNLFRPLAFSLSRARSLALSLSRSQYGSQRLTRFFCRNRAKQWNQLDPDFIPTGEGNLTLRTLALQCNPIEENGRQALLTAVAYNGGLETLSLGGGTMIGRWSKFACYLFAQACVHALHACMNALKYLVRQDVTDMRFRAHTYRGIS
jgi:hypothetical protein